LPEATKGALAAEMTRQVVIEIIADVSFKSRLRVLLQNLSSVIRGVVGVEIGVGIPVELPLPRRTVVGL
jgi:hypothetical protein